MAALPYVVVAAVAMLIAGLASAHAVLNKRDVRAAVGWVGMIWLVPFVGAALYAVLGVNRIRRSAAALLRAAPPTNIDVAGPATRPEDLAATIGGEHDHLDVLATLVGRVTARPLTPGNRVEPLVTGDVAYARMLAAIEGAERSVALLTYIFDDDAIGRRFVTALEGAVERGVQVRVLIDAAGIRYSRPPVDRALRQAGVTVARFLPFRILGLARFFNLRNHRKLMIVDGEVAFTGGMNIREHHALATSPPNPVQDVHFEVRGPAVTQLREVFSADWSFTTGEALNSSAWEAAPAQAGEVLSRAIVDGPDEDLDKCRWTLLGALGCARRRVQIVTPYFLPDSALITALSVAAMRGVAIDILIPERSNLPIVDWASWSQLWQLLERGCRIWLTPAPFDHSKLMLVDDVWLLCGSANWDPRSLRLNFELNLECYDAALASQVAELVEDKRSRGKRLTLADVQGLPRVTRLRNGVARLLMPYL